MSKSNRKATTKRELWKEQHRTKVAEYRAETERRAHVTVLAAIARRLGTDRDGEKVIEFTEEELKGADESERLSLGALDEEEGTGLKIRLYHSKEEPEDAGDETGEEPTGSQDSTCEETTA